MQTTIQSYIANMFKGQSTDSTDTAFVVANTKATLTRPAKSATRTVIDRTDSGLSDSNTLCVMPIGGNDNNDVVNVKVFGWKPAINMAFNSAVPQFYSGHICEVQGTLSSALLGLAQGLMAATIFQCDTLTLTNGVAVLHQGTADVDAAWFECDISGWDFIEVRGDLGANADTQNWLLWTK
jgi:hypothetical protein